MQVVEILSVRVLHTLAQKLGAGVSFSLQGKPEVAADHPGCRSAWCGPESLTKEK
jgi:hypothetical protein